MLSRLRSFLTTLIWRKRFEDDLAEELRFHLESHTEDLVRAGMRRAEAERRARAHLGSVERVKDASRLARGLRLADELERDLRLATRMLLKDRWHTLGAASVLALAIGSATGMFTLANAVLLRGLPVDDERIVFLGTRDADGREAGVSLSDLEDWIAGSRSLSEMAAYVGSGVNVGDDVRAPALLPATVVSANLFRLVGAEPALGRGFSLEEERQGAAAVVLGHALWQSRYGGDPEIVGREIRVDSRPSVVIGVMPEGFRFPRIAELWLPLGFMDAPAKLGGARSYFALGRLADGAAMDEARTELNAVAGRLAEKHPETHAGVQPIVDRYSRHAVAPQRGLLMLLMGVAGLVLLIACANVGGLLLSRSARRSGEVALRASLGASRGHVVRQVLVESTLLAAIGSLLGVAVAFVAVRFFGAQLEQCQLGCMPYWIEWTPDLKAPAFMGFTGLAAAALCGAAPALHVSRHEPDHVPGQPDPRGGRTRAARLWTNGLLAAQVALTLVLLIGAGLMARSFVAMHEAASVVVEGQNLLTFGMRFRESASREERKALLQAVEGRLAAMPELSASTLSSVLPFGGGHQRSLEIHGRRLRGPLPDVTYVTIGDDYFETLGLPLLEGRSFDRLDGGSARDLAIVNERFVDVYFRDENPLGQRIRLSDPGAPVDPTPWVMIAGVSPTVAQRSRPDEAEPVVYLPLVEDDGHGLNVMVRPRANAGPVLPRLRDELASVDRDLALFDPRTLEEAMASSRRWSRTLMTMLGLFGGLGLVLASVGVYGATAHAIAQRKQEIGIRMALGAPRNRILWQLTRRPTVAVVVGLALGTAGATIAGRVLDSLPVRTNSGDQLTFLAPLALVVLIALVAGLVSARQAAHIDPSSVLRSH